MVSVWEGGGCSVCGPERRFCLWRLENCIVCDLDVAFSQVPGISGCALGRGADGGVNNGGRGGGLALSVVGSLDGGSDSLGMFGFRWGRFWVDCYL